MLVGLGFAENMKSKTTTDPLVPFFEVVRLRWVLGYSLVDYGTSPVLTFNLINILAESENRSNALFWLTVWLTVKIAKVRSPKDEVSLNRGPVSKVD